jgi:hypothetical protein
VRKAEIIAAVVMACFIALAAHVVADRQKSAVPVSAWLQTDEFYVANALPGQDPILSARFLVLDESEGFWVSEVQKLTVGTQWVPVCSFSGTTSMSPAFTPEYSWADVVKPSCALPSGQYRLRMTFVLARPGWQTKRLPVTSNGFSVGGQDG